MKYLVRLFLVGMVCSIFLTGYASACPMPPIFGPGSREILLFVLIAAVGYFIWHKLTAINTRLDSLEKEIEEVKREMKGVNHE